MLETELGRPATHDELSERMDLPRKRYNQLSRLSRVGREINFSALDARHNLHGGDPANDRPWDVSDPKDRGPSFPIEIETMKDFVMRGLTREERLLLTLYYVEDLTMSEIGLVLDLSESRVSQIHKDVLGRLQTRFRKSIEADQLVA